MELLLRLAKGRRERVCVCTVVPADDDAAAADGAKRAPLTAATTSTGTTQAVLCCTSSSLSVVVPVLVSVVVVVAVVVMAPSTDFHRRRQHCTDTGANTNTDRHAGHELKLLLWRLQLMEALSFSLSLSLSFLVPSKILSGATLSLGSLPFPSLSNLVSPLPFSSRQ